MAAQSQSAIWFFALRNQREIVRMVGHNKEMRVNHADLLVMRDPVAKEYVYIPELGIEDVVPAPSSASNLPRRGMSITFMDVNRLWSTFFEVGGELRLGLWSRKWEYDPIADREVMGPMRERFSGVCNTSSDVATLSSVRVEASFFGTLHQITSVSAVRMTQNAQNAIAKRRGLVDNSLNHIDRAALGKWMGKN